MRCRNIYRICRAVAALTFYRVRWLKNGAAGQVFIADLSNSGAEATDDVKHCARWLHGLERRERQSCMEGEPSKMR